MSWLWERGEAQAAQHAAQLAWQEQDGHTLTYGELWANARALAQAWRPHLGARPTKKSGGVGDTVPHLLPPPSKRAGLLAGHDHEAMAALWGILGAGGVYVPLDAREPLPRLKALAREAKLSAVVAPRRLAQTALALDLPPLWLDHAPLDHAPLDHAPKDDAPGQEAYVLYTSGSTGAPKGVRQSQQNVWRHAQRYAQSLALGPSDRVAWLAPLGVDAAVMDLFGAWAAGASLHPWDLRALGVEGLGAWLRAREISVLHTTPTILRAWLRTHEQSPLPSLRAVVLGGEAARASDLAALWPRLPPHAQLIHGLGPTECTVALQARFVHGHTPQGGELLPVGWPVEGVRAHVWDPLERETARGELVLESESLALGYEGEARPGAFFARDGRRFYKTGDEVEVTPEGLVPRGRLDRAVKLAGLRVELGEVEAALARLPHVRSAHVEKREALNGEGLAAWLEVDPGFDARAARDALLGQVPARLVPRWISAHPQLPWTPSGKLDREALRDLPPQAAPVEPPRGELEARLAALWSELLDVDVGRGEDLLALGMDSLCALRFVAQARARWGVELPLDALFSERSVARLGAWWEQHARPTAAPAPPDDEPDAPAPKMTEAQRRIALATRLDPGRAWSLGAAMRCVGPLDVGLLSQAWAEVTQAAEEFQLRLAPEGHPLGLVRVTPAPAPWDVVEVGDLDEARRLTQTALDAPTDPAREPWVRATLYRASDAEGLLAVVAHHLALDGEGLRRLLARWEARMAGPLVPSAASTRHAATLAARAEEAQRSAAWPRHAGWWERSLAGVEAVAWPRQEGDRQERAPDGQARSSWSGAWIEALRLQARAQGVTLPVLLLGTLGQVLARALGQAKLCVGWVSEGRAGLREDTLAPMLRVVPVVLGEPEAWDALRARLLGALEASELPWEQAAPRAKPQGLSHGAWPEVLFLFHPRPRPALSLPGVEIEALPLEPVAAPAPLSFSVRDLGGGLEVCVDFQRSCASEAWVEAARHRWEQALRDVAAGQGGAGEAWGGPTPDERAWLWTVGTGPARPSWDLDATIEARVAAQAAQRPHALALAQGERTLTYAQLRAWTGALKGALSAWGVGPGAWVVVASAPTLALPAAMLAVWELGAAFAPLDPSWSPSRLAQGLALVQPRAVLSDAPNNPAWRGWPVLGLSDDEMEGLGRGATPRGASAEAGPAGHEDERVAYGMFTSGTSGASKLAVLGHRGLRNRFLWMDERFGAGEATATVQTTPTHFDSALWQLLWPLTLGGRAVLPDAPLPWEPRRLVETIERHGATLVDFVPSVLRASVEGLRQAAPAQLASLRDVILGGERLDARALRRFSERFGWVRAVNLYGPTEATIGCVAHEVVLDDARQPIGRPLPHVALRVCDARGRLCPPQAPGELWIGGACVGLGYKGREEESARFWTDEAGEPWYKTGDLVRWDEAGRLEFLGRLDLQEKLGGVRVEPEAWERALLQHPEVQEAAVVVVGEGSRRALGACVSPGPLPEDLRAWALRRGPPGPAPSVWWALEALPRGGGGKVDRAGVARSAPRIAGGQRARSAQERAVAGAWAEVLGVDVDQVDVEREFAAQGGDSLGWLELHRRLEAAFGRRIPLGELLARPSCEGQARWLSGEEGGGAALEGRARQAWRRARGG